MTQNENTGKNNEKDNGKKKKKGPKKGKKKKDKKVTVYYPTVISNPETGESKEEISEAELSYNDALLGVKMEKLAAKGLDNNQIIEALGISRFTFYQRLKSDSYFSYCLLKHRGIAVKQVECALFNSALGYHYKEEHVTPMGIVVEAKKYALPNVQAQKEFLHNRASKEWRKKIEYSPAVTGDLASVQVVIRRREE